MDHETSETLGAVAYGFLKGLLHDVVSGSRFETHVFIEGRHYPLGPSRQDRIRLCDESAHTYQEIYACPGCRGFGPVDSDDPNALRRYLYTAADIDHEHQRKPDQLARGVFASLVRREGASQKAPRFSVYGTLNCDSKFASIDTVRTAPKLCHIWYL